MIQPPPTSAHTAMSLRPYSALLAVALLACGTLTRFAPTLVAQPAADAPMRTVLVTGASSGIGRVIAERLAQEGWFVWAGARSADDIAALSARPNMRGVRLDVTVQADLDSVVALIRRDGRGLHGLVNNAGVAAIAPLVEMSDDDMRQLFDVNVFGPFRVTKAVAPLLIASRGRVAITSSISGVLSGGLLGAYSMSKHAIEAYGDALGVELSRVGVRVSLVEPGNYRSEIGRTTQRQIQRQMDAHPGSPWADAMRSTFTAMGNYDAYPEPTAVADAVLHALTSEAPLARYMVVPEARQGDVTLRKAVDELVQLNQWNAFRRDRDALVRMLDSALARHP